MITYCDFDVEKAVEDARFAKVVNTASGTAILIGGDVVEVIGGNSGFWVDVLTRALRRVDGRTDASGDQSRPKPSPPGRKS